jgi:hypothetical protein
MRAILSNFLGLRNTGMPLLNCPIKNDKIHFTVNHTTDNMDVKATGTIDITDNSLVLNGTTSEHDRILLIEDEGRRHLFLYGERYFAQQAFESLSPHIELSCSNKKCKFNYYLSGDIIQCHLDPLGWRVKPFLLFQETFSTETLWVQNNWIYNETYIYPLDKHNAEPLKVPLMDFEAMDKQKLLTRIATLVVFS